MIRFTILLFFICLLQNSSQRSTPEDDSYVAAVVEYQVQADVENNIRNYVQLIQDAAQQNADVVVFPEMTLTRGTRAAPVPINDLLKQYPIPALEPDRYDEILVSISAAARQYQVYVVINVQEEMDCTNAEITSNEYCPTEEVYRFNTNVVFDRTGAIIDRYRKINLFGEFTRTPALRPDLGIFTTDFGVTFGHFVCFDLMFQVPAVQVVEKYSLTDVIFTTMWFSEMPYLTAVQIQESYAYAMNVNFIASGANNVNVGSAGSGIYSGKAGALVSVMPGVPTTRLLISRVPKVPGQVTFSVPGPIYDNPSDHDSLVLISDPSLPSHVSRQLVQGFQEFTLIDKEVTCRFRVRLNQRAGEVTHNYRAFIQDGSNTYARREIGVASCLLVACKSDDAKSCAYRFLENDVEIQELEIEMTTYSQQYNTSLKCDNIVYFPVSLRNNKFPLSRVNFTYIDTQNDGPLEENWVEAKEKSAREDVLYKITAPQSELVSFGIWGRLYTKDVNHVKEITENDVNDYIKIEDRIYGTGDDKNEQYKYRAAAFSGVRSFSGVETGGSRVCSIVSCTGDTMDTCGRRIDEYIPNTTAIFEELTIIATVPTPVPDSEVDASDSAFFPLSLDVSIMPLDPTEFTYDSEIQGENTVFTLNLLNTQAEIYTFAVWGRVFDRDGSEATPALDSSTLNNVSGILLFLAIMTFFFRV